MESLAVFGVWLDPSRMVDVPLRHRSESPRRAGPRPAAPDPAGPEARSAAPGAFSRWLTHHRPLVLLVGGILLIVAIGGLFQSALELYRERLVLTGLTDNPRPVNLAIAAEELAIPGNMLRYAKTRIGGPVERADLALHWPDLRGYSEDIAEAFKDGAPSAPIVYATIAARDAPLDSTGRLDEVYARFFVDAPIAGPEGLVGRKLNQDSGYGGEIVFFMPSEPRPFVARCLAEETPEVPATCLRDVNFGRSLSLLYRFNRDLLKDWRALDASMQKLAGGFLKN